jgi:hypothetical protein
MITELSEAIDVTLGDPDQRIAQLPIQAEKAQIPGHPGIIALMSVPKKTSAERRSLSEERGKHLDWLASRGLREPPWPLRSEDAYTGLLIAGLLSPETSTTVCQALMAGSPLPAPPPWPVAGAVWPRWGADVVAWADDDDGAVALVVEHKRFESHSNAPGYRSDPDSPWQTDQVYGEIVRGEPPSRVAGIPQAQVAHCVVLDGYGLPMERIFPDGEFNDRWLVTSYHEFGSVLRAAYDRSVPGLVPLLVGLYAGLQR